MTDKAEQEKTLAKISKCLSEHDFESALMMADAFLKGGASGEQRSMALGYKGAALEEQHRVAEAITAYRESLAPGLDHENAPYISKRLAFLLFEIIFTSTEPLVRLQVEEVMKYSEAALKDSPDDPKLHHVLGLANLCLGNHLEALEFLKKNVELLGEKCGCSDYLNYANALMGIETSASLEKAEELFKKALPIAYAERNSPLAAYIESCIEMIRESGHCGQGMSFDVTLN
ncbi:MAG: hypothetical protein WBK55_06950 [Alphaproteobacteria bacterium]